MALNPWYRFNPTDTQIVNDYLKPKNLGDLSAVERAINDVRINEHEPWDLPKLAKLPSRPQMSHFFTQLDTKFNKKGTVTNRKTKVGFWKPTGKDREIEFQGEKIGTKKTLVFHEGHGPKASRTDWVMHEYHLVNQEADAYVLCKVWKKRNEECGDSSAVFEPPCQIPEGTSEFQGTSSNPPIYFDELGVAFSPIQDLNGFNRDYNTPGFWDIGESFKAEASEACVEQTIFPIQSTPEMGQQLHEHQDFENGLNFNQNFETLLLADQSEYYAEASQAYVEETIFPIQSTPEMGQQLHEHQDFENGHEFNQNFEALLLADQSEYYAEASQAYVEQTIFPIQSTLEMGHQLHEHQDFENGLNFNQNFETPLLADQSEYYAEASQAYVEEVPNNHFQETQEDFGGDYSGFYNNSLW